MRKLVSKDLFAALRVVKEIGIKEQLAEMANVINSAKESEEEDLEEKQRKLGVDLILGTLANAGTERGERAFFAFLEGPLEVPADELKEMDLLEFVDLLKTYVDSIDKESWKSFFDSLSDLIRKTR